MLLVAAVLLASAVAINGQSTCGGSLSLASGITHIASPNFPRPYPNNANCQWSISAPSGRTLRFTASQFSTQSSRDVLTINGQTFSGNFGPQGVVVNSPATVTFTSDFSVNNAGFVITVSIVVPPTTPPPPTTPAPTTDPNCGGTEIVFSGSTKYFWLNGYGNNANCTWSFQATPGQSLLFNTVRFGTEACCDRLTFFNVNTGTQIGQFAGTSGPSRFRSNTNFVRAVFTSDSSVTGIGFNISVTIDFCPAGQNPCPNHPTVCIASNQYCDNVTNCPDNIDEAYCNAECGRPAIPPNLSLTKDGKIVGGAEAVPHSWPWQFAFTSASGSQFCGGSIISNRWAMTAAHCCAGRTPSSSRVLVGAHLLSGTEGMVSHEIQRIINHPQYSSSPTRYDFCLLEVAQPIQFNPRVSPICIANAQDAPPGAKAFTTGWGNTGGRMGSEEYMHLLDQFDAGKLSKEEAQRVVDLRVNMLRQVDVNITTQEYCSDAYPGSIDDSMICAANPGKDSCQGDSGGPLKIQRSNGEWALVGVTSWGRGCALPQYPGVYGRISTVLDWIRQTMNS